MLIFATSSSRFIQLFIDTVPTAAASPADTFATLSPMRSNAPPTLSAFMFSDLSAVPKRVKRTVPSSTLPPRSLIWFSVRCSAADA